MIISAATVLPPKLIYQSSSTAALLARWNPEELSNLRAQVSADIDKHLGRHREGDSATPNTIPLTQRNNSSPPSQNFLACIAKNTTFQIIMPKISSIRANSFAMRTGHRGLVKDHHKALALCGLGTFGEKHEVKPMAHLVCDHRERRADIRRVSMCGSSWSCPVCAGRNSASRTRALQPQIASFMAAGGTSHLLTMTLRHTRQMPLNESLDALSRAWSGVTSGKAWQRLSSQGDAEWVRGFDVTHSARHGWNPHIHSVVFLGSEFENPDAIAHDILSRWRKKLAAIGWESSPSAQDHRRVDNPAKAAAYAISPASIYEPTAMAIKRIRTGTNSRTPFEILSGANGFGRESARDKALWVEYVKSVKGRRQAACSKGLTFKLEPTKEPALNGDIVAGLGREAVLELDKIGLTANLLEQIENHAGDLDGVRVAVRDVLSRLETRDWRIFEWNEAGAEIEHGRERARLEAETAKLKDDDGWRRKLDYWDKWAMSIQNSVEEQIVLKARTKQKTRLEAMYSS